MAVLSVIIPTLNEAAALPATLEYAHRARRHPRTEFIVSDCGSTDATRDIARRFGAHVVCGGTSRATALNLGANAARGSGLLFLHADSKLPRAYDVAILNALSKPSTVGGAFDFNWSSHDLSHGLNRQYLRAIRIINRIRFRWTGNFYGDQGIFVSAETFHRLGGFPEVPLMEDIKFSQKLKNAGKVAILSPAIRTSPRRFVSRGVLRQFACDLRLLTLDACGLTPDRLWQRYNDLNKSAAYRGRGVSERKAGKTSQLSSASAVEIDREQEPQTPVRSSLRVGSAHRVDRLPDEAPARLARW